MARRNNVTIVGSLMWRGESTKGEEDKGKKVIAAEKGKEKAGAGNTSQGENALMNGKREITNEAGRRLSTRPGKVGQVKKGTRVAIDSH